MNRTTLLCTLLSCLLLPLMITNESFWIDEGSTGLFARQPDLSTWWSYISVNTTSDSQMPLEMFAAWIVGKVFGSAEWQLRALNVFWGVIGLLALAVVAQKLRLWWLPLFFAVQPYFWFYINEARPYTLQIAIGCWLLVGMTQFLESKARGIRWAAVVGLAGVVLCYATMLAPITLIALGIAMVTIAIRNKWEIERRVILVLAGAAALALPTALYYIGTLKRGAEGAKLWDVDAKMLGFIGYELTGLSGLGPSILELRDLARASNRLELLMQHGMELGAVALLGFSFLGVILLGLRAFCRIKEDNVTFWAATFLVAIVAIIFCAGSFAVHKPFWARHFAPVFPFLVTSIAILIAKAARVTPPILFRPIAGLFLFCLILSSLSFRFAPRHRKENYRAAAEFAKHAQLQGQTAWWIAAPEAARYYGVPEEYVEVDRSAFSNEASNSTASSNIELSVQRQPDIIILSRPEAFDPGNAAQKLIQSGKYRRIASVQGFQFFERKP